MATDQTVRVRQSQGNGDDDGDNDDYKMTRSPKWLRIGQCRNETVTGKHDDDDHGDTDDDTYDRCHWSKPATNGDKF